LKPYETENESFIFNFTKPAYKGIVHKVISLSFDDPVLSVFLPSCFDTPLLFPMAKVRLPAFSCILFVIFAEVKSTRYFSLIYLKIFLKR
jgi:hypothetical protein